MSAWLELIHDVLSLVCQLVHHLAGTGQDPLKESLLLISGLGWLALGRSAGLLRWWGGSARLARRLRVDGYFCCMNSLGTIKASQAVVLKKDSVVASQRKLM